MRIKDLSLVACTLAALGQTPAWGQLIAACRGDVQRFCAGMELGGGRIVRCLEENAAKLSAGCKEAIGASGAPGAEAEAGGGKSGAKTACRGDAMRFCSDAIGDQTKMKHCLQSHAAQLSDGCKTAIIAEGN